MTELLQKMQQLQLKAVQRGQSFMIISDGEFINVSIVLPSGPVHSFRIEVGYFDKTKEEITQRIKNTVWQQK